jgi:hypothetical protein
LVADIGVEATKTIITNLTERTARGDLIYSHSLYFLSANQDIDHTISEITTSFG